jgi:hypothetical protein
MRTDMTNILSVTFSCKMVEFFSFQTLGYQEIDPLQQVKVIEKKNKLIRIKIVTMRMQHRTNKLGIPTLNLDTQRTGYLTS